MNLRKLIQEEVKKQLGLVEEKVYRPNYAFVYDESANKPMVVIDSSDDGEELIRNVLYGDIQGEDSRRIFKDIPVAFDGYVHATGWIHDELISSKTGYFPIFAYDKSGKSKIGAFVYVPKHRRLDWSKEGKMALDMFKGKDFGDISKVFNGVFDGDKNKQRSIK